MSLLSDYSKIILGRPHRVLFHVHVGKCGGGSVWQTIKDNESLGKRYRKIRHIHSRKAKYYSRYHYVISIRNPVERSISAFNWRYKLVLEDKVKGDPNSREGQVLKKYETINGLASKLYRDGILDEQVAADFNSIKHLDTDINFHLDEILPQLQSDQILAVLCQESLNDDLKTHLNIDMPSRHHENRSKQTNERLYLSEESRSNLKKFLSKDYDCIRALNEKFPIDEKILEKLLK